MSVLGKKKRINFKWKSKNKSKIHTENKSNWQRKQQQLKAEEINAILRCVQLWAPQLKVPRSSCCSGGLFA